MKPYQLILICMALCAAAAAQNADQLFNPAAKEYIYGNIPVASNLVHEALAKFPKDEKILKLKKLIEEQPKEDQQQQDQQQDQEQQQDQQQQDQEQQKQDQQDQQNQEQEQQDQTDQSDQEKKEQPQPAQPQQAGEMSPQEAQQLLDAMKQNEKDQRSDLRLYLGQPVRVNKDW